jgi:hypothetical protein
MLKKIAMQRGANTMKGVTNYLTERSWEDTLIATYVLVSERLPAAVKQAGFVRQRGPEPTYDDAQIITIALAAEYWFGGDEEKTLHYLRQYHARLWSNGVADTSRFNVRRRQLGGVLEALRCQLRDAWRQQHPLSATTPAESPADDWEEPGALRARLVDSAPVMLTSRGRGGRTPTFEPENRAAWFGVCTSQDFKFFGGRVHLSVALDQMIDDWVIAPASFVDFKVLPALCEGKHDLIYIGDRGYNSPETEALLWQRGRHQLLPLRKNNHKQPWPHGIQRILGKLRHRVETAFSVLTTVFDLRHPAGRSFDGFVARTATQILAYTLSFFLALLP